MASLKIYELANVHFDENDTLALATLLTRRGQDGEVIDPPVFPLKQAKVVFNGNQASISILAEYNRNRRICRMVDAKLTEPIRDGDPVIVSGIVTELAELGMSAEDAKITAIIDSFVTCSTC